MTKEDKIKELAFLSEKLKDKPNIYLADAGGLSVAEVNDLRRMCHAQGVEMRKVKNTLLRKALEGATGNYEEIFGVLKSHTSVFFVHDNLKAPAEIIKKFRGKKTVPTLKGAYIDEAIFLGDESLATLVALKSKNELIGEIVGLLQSPMRNVLGALQSGGNIIAGLLKTLGEREEKE